MRLVVDKKRKNQTGEFARKLIKQTKSEVSNAVLQEKVLEFIQTVVMDIYWQDCTRDIPTTLIEK